MALTDIDIQNLSINHYKGTPFPTFLADKIQNAANVDLNEIGLSDRVNDLGEAYFMTLTLTLPSGEQIRLPHEPLVSFVQRKRIVKTQVAGGKRAGTVKEFINPGDYFITIRGICIDSDSPNSYPTEQVNLVKRVVEQNVALEVENSLLNFFGIYRIVVDSHGWDDMKGVPGAQAYVLRTISDIDFYASLADDELNGL